MFKFTATPTNTSDPVCTQRFKFDLRECHIHHWRVNYLVALWHWRREVIYFAVVIAIGVNGLHKNKAMDCRKIIKLISVAFIGYWLVKEARKGFRCCRAWELIEDCKEGYLRVGTDYKLCLLANLLLGYTLRVLVTSSLTMEIVF